MAGTLALDSGRHDGVCALRVAQEGFNQEAAPIVRSVTTWPTASASAWASSLALVDSGESRSFRQRQDLPHATPARIP